MYDQWGNYVGPGYIGGEGQTVESISLANGGDGSGSWQDIGTSNQYAGTQQDLGAIRDLMAQQGAGYMVTGNASAADGSNTSAYLPQMLEKAGIDVTQGILKGYEGATGSAYRPGSSTTYDPTTGAYTAVGGSPSMGMMGGTATGIQGAPTGSFGGGAATANRTPEQLATIKGTWQQFTSGQKTAAEIQQAMTQYGVNFADISAATGIPVATLQQQLGGVSQQPKPNQGSPYNPGIITPNPDGSGRPAGSTHPVSGMVNLDTTGQDYNTQMQNYYKAYFGGASPDMGLLNSWYDSEYKPPVTGYVKPSATAQAATPAGTPTGGTGGSGSRNGTLGNQTPGSPLGTGVMTDAIRTEALNTFKKYIGLGLTPAAAAAAVQSMMATNEALNAINESEDPIGTWINMQNVFDEDGNIRSIVSPASIAAADERMFSGSGGNGPSWGGVNNSAGTGFGSSVHGGSSFA